VKKYLLLLKPREIRIVVKQKAFGQTNSSRFGEHFQDKKHICCSIPWW